MAWTAPEVLAASRGCVRRALIGLPSESRTGPLLSDAAAGARGAAGGGACLAAPGDRTPARDICRPQGSCDGLRSMLLAHSLCFRVAGGPRPRPRCGRLGRGRGLVYVSGGARGCAPDPKTKSKPEGAFSAGRVGWGGAGSRGGDASMQPVLLAKASKKAKRRALKPLFTALGVGPALPRLPSAALIADCVSPAQERRAGAAGTAQASRPQHSVNLERGADAPSTPAPERQ